MIRKRPVYRFKRRQRLRQTLPDVGLSEVLFEFAKVGRHLRVTAIDPATRIEVSMIADPKCGETLIKRLAVRKLAYVIGKRRNRLKGDQGDGKERDDESQSGWDM